MASLRLYEQGGVRRVPSKHVGAANVDDTGAAQKRELQPRLQGDATQVGEGHPLPPRDEVGHVGARGRGEDAPGQVGQVRAGEDVDVRWKAEIHLAAGSNGRGV
jgi:hypothetical protein